jgi:hypothetical protein
VARFRGLRYFLGPRSWGLRPRLYAFVRPAHSRFAQGSRADLSARLAKLSESILAVIETLNADQLEKESPQVVFDPDVHRRVPDSPLRTSELAPGQVDYLRRLLIKDEALG